MMAGSRPKKVSVYLPKYQSSTTCPEIKPHKVDDCVVAGRDLDGSGNLVYLVPMNGKLSRTIAGFEWRTLASLASGVDEEGESWLVAASKFDSWYACEVRKKNSNSPSARGEINITRGGKKVIERIWLGGAHPSSRAATVPGGVVLSDDNLVSVFCVACRSRSIRKGAFGVPVLDSHLASDGCKEFCPLFSTTRRVAVNAGGSPGGVEMPAGGARREDLVDVVPFPVLTPLRDVRPVRVFTPGQGFVHCPYWWCEKTFPSEAWPIFNRFHFPCHVSRARRGKERIVQASGAVFLRGGLQTFWDAVFRLLVVYDASVTRWVYVWDIAEIPDGHPCLQPGWSVDVVVAVHPSSGGEVVVGVPLFKAVGLFELYMKDAPVFTDPLFPSSPLEIPPAKGPMQSAEKGLRLPAATRVPPGFKVSSYRHLFAALNLHADPLCEVTMDPASRTGGSLTDGRSDLLKYYRYLLRVLDVLPVDCFEGDFAGGATDDDDSFLAAIGDDLTTLPPPARGRRRSLSGSTVTSSLSGSRHVDKRPRIRSPPSGAPVFEQGSLGTRRDEEPLVNRLASVASSSLRGTLGAPRPMIPITPPGAGSAESAGPASRLFSLDEFLDLERRWNHHVDEIRVMETRMDLMGVVPGPGLRPGVIPEEDSQCGADWEALRSRRALAVSSVALLEAELDTYRGSPECKEDFERWCKLRGGSASDVDASRDPVCPRDGESVVTMPSPGPCLRPRPGDARPHIPPQDAIDTFLAAVRGEIRAAPGDEVVLRPGRVRLWGRFSDSLSIAILYNHHRKLICSTLVGPILSLNPLQDIVVARGGFSELHKLLHDGGGVGADSHPRSIAALLLSAVGSRLAYMSGTDQSLRLAVSSTKATAGCRRDANMFTTVTHVSSPTRLHYWLAFSPPRFRLAHFHPVLAQEYMAMHLRAALQRWREDGNFHFAMERLECEGGIYHGHMVWYKALDECLILQQDTWLAGVHAARLLLRRQSGPGSRGSGGDATDELSWLREWAATCDEVRLMYHFYYFLKSIYLFCG
jgi:hypothetical protein